HVSDQGFHVIAKDGLTDLGGKEFDEAVAEMVHEQFEQSTGKTLDFSGRQLQQLRAFSEEVKIELSMPGIQYIKRVCLIGNESVEVFITRQAFEQAIKPDVERTLKILKRCLSSAGIREEDVDVLLLVGGSSMVPFIRSYLAEKLPKLANKIRFQ